MKTKRLYRIKNEGMILGVCAGIADYFNLDPSLVRIIWVLFVFAGGSGFLAYIIAGLILPEKSTMS